MDIISTLPDPILCHILSFLPIHFSATTSVLARRWRYLWTYVRNLYFTDEEYLDYDSCSEDKMEFPDMIDRVLLLHNGSIDSLIIRAVFDTIVRERQVEAWISTAIARNVQVLDLSDLSGLRLAQCCFKCSTLVELTLHDCEISAKPGAVCLPRLKKLHLRSNCYENDESLPNLVSGCSAIEDLLIERDFCENMACCYVGSPTLKSLVLWFEFPCRMSDHDDDDDDDYEHKLVLDIPAVQYLQIHDNVSHIIRAEKLSSLVVAEIWFSHNFHDEEKISRWRNMFQFVENLSNAKSLTFRSPASMKLLNLTSSVVTTRFRNLTKLEYEADWHFLTELLESAYKLESLTIREVKEKLKCWREPKHLPKCLLSSLKCVSIRGFAGGEHELNMIRYILRHAKVLKRIKIFPASRGKDASFELKMLKQISYFSRGSRACRLTFV